MEIALMGQKTALYLLMSVACFSIVLAFIVIRQQRTLRKEVLSSFPEFQKNRKYLPLPKFPEQKILPAQTVRWLFILTVGGMMLVAVGLIGEGLSKTYQPWFLHPNGQPKSLLTLLDQAGIVVGYFTFIAAGGALWLYSKRRLSKPTKGDVITSGELLREYRGGLILVSRGNNKLPDWLLHLCVQRRKWIPITLLYSTDTRENAKRLSEKYGQSIPFLLPPGSDEEELNRLIPPLDYREARRIINGVIDEFLESSGIPADKLFIDITGGTVVMSVAAMEAARAKGLNVIYLSGKDQKLVTEKNYQEPDAAIVFDLSLDS